MKTVSQKVALPEISPEELEKFRNGLVSLSKEEIAADERLSYILNRAQYLCNSRPDGATALNEEETKDFENWLGI